MTSGSSIGPQGPVKPWQSFLLKELPTYLLFAKSLTGSEMAGEHAVTQALDRNLREYDGELSHDDERELRVGMLRAIKTVAQKLQAADPALEPPILNLISKLPYADRVAYALIYVIRADMATAAAVTDESHWEIANMLSRSKLAIALHKSRHQDAAAPSPSICFSA